MPIFISCKRLTKTTTKRRGEGQNPNIHTGFHICESVQFIFNSLVLLSLSSCFFVLLLLVLPTAVYITVYLNLFCMFILFHRSFPHSIVCWFVVPTGPKEDGQRADFVPQGGQEITETAEEAGQSFAGCQGNDAFTASEVSKQLPCW